MKSQKSRIIFPKMMCVLLLSGLLCVAAPANMPVAHASDAVSIVQKGNTVSVRAEGASLRSVLKALGEKTGILFVVHESVPDRPVTLDVDSLPLASAAAGSVDSVLEQMGLRNTVTAYDGKTGRTVVHVLPDGMAYSDFVRGPSVIRIGQAGTSAAGMQVLTVKGKEVVAEALPETGLAVRYIRDEVMLRFQPDVPASEIGSILDRYGLTLISTAGDPLLQLGFVKVAVPGGQDIRELIGQLAKEPRLKSPEPNYVANLFQSPDPLYPLQWYMAGMGFDRIWSRVKGKSEIAVAVVDTGVDSRHPDLQGKVLSGYDFVYGSPHAGDDLGHGTFVAGIIAADANNGIGIRGLCGMARILPVKVLDRHGWGTYEDVARGIVFAADRGARVINLSLGGYGASWLLGAAVDYALSKGCVVVAAGGNDGVARAVYPAACSGVIGVGALAPDGKPWVKSNRGWAIDIFAPGVDIVSTGPEGGYVRASGTSGSAPMVSALAALLLSEHPDLSVRGIENLIREEAGKGAGKQ